MNNKKKKKASHSLIDNVIYLYKLQWRHSKLSLLLLIADIPISLGLSYLGIYLPKVVVSQVIGYKDIYSTLLPILIIGVAILALNLAERLISTINSAISSRFRDAMTDMKNRKCLSTDYENIESPNFRFLMGRASESLWGSSMGSTVEKMCSGSISLITSILSGILFGTILTIANPILIAILIVIPIVHYFSLKWLRQFQYNAKDFTAPIDKKLRYISENASKNSAAKDIRVYKMKDWLLNMYNMLSKERLSWDFKVSKRQFLINLLDGFLILVRDGAAYFIMIAMVIGDKLAIDNFVLCFSAVTAFTGTISSIINQISSLNSTSLLTCDLRDFFDYPEKRKRDEITEIKNENITHGIKIENLSFSYAGAQKSTISNLSCTIAPGEKIAIVGLNGAGKTTLIKLLMGLYTPTSGDIFVDEINIDNYEKSDYYKLFSAVFQDHKLMPISIVETVSCTEANLADRNRVIECLKMADLYDKISTLPNGVDTLINRQINESGIELSGGECQKLLLARALYKNASILILDEPTAAMDPISENILYNKYNDLFKNKTAIFISHRLSSTRFCDRIFLMKDGHFIEIGTHDELISMNGEYKRLYEIQSQHYRSKGEEGK